MLIDLFRRRFFQLIGELDCLQTRSNRECRSATFAGGAFSASQEALSLHRVTRFLRISDTTRLFACALHTADKGGRSTSGVSSGGYLLRPANIIPVAPDGPVAPVASRSCLLRPAIICNVRILRKFSLPAMQVRAGPIGAGARHVASMLGWGLGTWPVYRD